jgi:2,3-bisphosphoglycerate-independent phosphoglycerate mutase
MTIITNRIKKPVGLIVLDGWGVAPAWGGNAISEAKTKTFNKILQSYPNTTLLASGVAVGLPINAPGNSEAGHLNIGAGRVVHQDISIIDASIDSGEFFKNKILLSAISHAVKNNSNLHLLGLLSDTGTHSHVRHLYSLLKLCKENNFSRVYIHLFSDGRDSSPMNGIELANNVMLEIKKIGIGHISSISGRFFAMDRDNRWGRISRTYNMLTKGQANSYPNVMNAFSSAYAQGQNDEFIEPRIIRNQTEPLVNIGDNDSVISFNFRSDRMKELIKAFLSPSIPEFKDRTLLKNLLFISMSIYEDISLATKAFSPEKVDFPLSRIISESGMRQFHISETEKYPHITYFINGGREKAFLKEDRFLIPSPRGVKTYDFVPKMSAEKVAIKTLQLLEKNLYDTFMLNFANADMVGHSGNFSATVHAIECVDGLLSSILNKIISLGGTALIVGDHGNAEQMVNPRSGEPDTEHTTNPVPFAIVSEEPEIKKIKLHSDGILASVAPTMLEIMKIEKPEIMQNQSLIIKEFNG